MGQKNAIHVATCVLSLCVGWTLMALALGRIAATSPTPTRGAMEWMREHQHEVELLVMGPSFVRSQFIPPEFERQLEGAGVRLVSFGYSGRGLMGAELDHYI